MSGSPEPVPRFLYGERIIAADETVDGIGRTVAGIVLDPPRKAGWRIAFTGTCGLLVLGVLARPLQGSAAEDSAFVTAGCDWWLGIAHGSLLVSAVLLLLGVEWRCAIIRIAETLALLATVAAVVCSVLQFGRLQTIALNRIGLFPAFGRPSGWETTGLCCFLVVSLTLWSIGLLPDLAVLRDRAAASSSPCARNGRSRPSALRARIYAALSWRWHGSAVQWQRWTEAYRAVALLGILLVVVLQTGSSVLVAGAAPTGRADTLLPVTLLIDAVLSGLGLTAALAVALRAVYGLDGLITRRHLDVLARTLLVLGLASLYCHATEIVSTLLQGDASARAVVARGVSGDLAWAFWTVIACGLLPLQIFWLPRARRSGLVVALAGLLAAIGAYADRVMVVAVIVRTDGAADLVAPGGVGLPGMSLLAASVGLALALLLLCLRTCPIVSIAQTRQLAIAHNGVAALVGAGSDAVHETLRSSGAPTRRIAAVFASEKELAAATHALLGRDRTLRVDALGPVPLPSVVGVLRPVEPPVRRVALAGALTGGVGFLAVCQWRGYPFADAVTWSSLDAWTGIVASSLSVAMMAGTLAVLIAVAARGRPTAVGEADTKDRGVLRAIHDRFVLIVEMREGSDEAERVERVLAALASDGRRPLSMHGPVP